MNVYRFLVSLLIFTIIVPTPVMGGETVSQNLDECSAPLSDLAKEVPESKANKEFLKSIVVETPILFGRYFDAAFRNASLSSRLPIDRMLENTSQYKIEIQNFSESVWQHIADSLPLLPEGSLATIEGKNKAIDWVNRMNTSLKENYGKTLGHSVHRVGYYDSRYDRYFAGLKRSESALSVEQYDQLSQKVSEINADPVKKAQVIAIINSTAEEYAKIVKLEDKEMRALLGLGKSEKINNYYYSNDRDLKIIGVTLLSAVIGGVFTSLFGSEYLNIHDVENVVVVGGFTLIPATYLTVKSIAMKIVRKALATHARISTPVKIERAKRKLVSTVVSK